MIYIRLFLKLFKNCSFFFLFFNNRKLQNSSFPTSFLNAPASVQMTQNLIVDAGTIVVF